MIRPGITFEQLTAVVNHPDSVPDLQKYFATSPHEQTRRFTGGWFDRLGADHPNSDPHRISTDDLVAVQLLGVHIPSSWPSIFSTAPTATTCSSTCALSPPTVTSAIGTRAGTSPMVAQQTRHGGC